MKKLIKILLVLVLCLCTVLPMVAQADTPDYGWKYNEYIEKWWWLDKDGTYPANAWRKIDNVWYYFGYDGYWVDDNSYEAGSLKGIDVSKWQGDINWKAVKDFGIEFAFIRMSYGIGTLDSYYEKNMQGAEEVGIPAGVYYYSLALDEVEAVRDAQFVIENLEGKLVSYPVVIDLEDSSQAHLSKEELGRIAKAFCNEISAAGYTPMIYCNENWYKNKIDTAYIPDVGKWIARYNGIYDANIVRDIWQCTSQGRVDGIKGDVDINFGFTDYSKIIEPRRTAAEGYHKTKGVWYQNSVGWWYRYYGGSYPANQWEFIDGEYFWFNANGYMQTGWIWDGSNYYYADSLGHLQNGWQYIDSQWYYFNADGRMQKGWILLGNYWYYLKESGAMATGWLRLNNDYYYLNDVGIMQTGWLRLGNKWYYLNDGGVMQTGWLKLGDYWYYLNAGGDMVTGWKYINNTWYYFNSSGIWIP